VLDGLEVTIVGSLGGVLERADTLALTAAQVGLGRLAVMSVGPWAGRSFLDGWPTGSAAKRCS
jgi:hypothetical protein